MQKKILFTFLFLLILFCVNAQYYVVGQDPASTRWKQINTDHFRLVYPESFEKKAQYTANLLESAYPKVSRTLGNEPKKIPVLFHTQDVTANAFSVWAPRRMEFYTCAPQNTYAQNWLEQLVIHEFRHTVQMDKVNQGFTKALSYILGEQGTAAVVGIYVPLWLMEGDAVCTETGLSYSGRGRIPGFEMELRAQLLEKGGYKYDKAVYGSFRDYVTDHYVLGYQIAAYARKQYGADVWNKTLNSVAKYPFSVIPFDMGLKKTTGLKKIGLFNRTLAVTDSLWRQQSQLTSYTPYHKVLTDPHSTYARYKYPHYLNDSMILAERTTLDDISRFVMIKREGGEKVVFTPGLYASEVISVASNPANYSELIQNKPGTFTAENLSTNKGLVVWTEKSNDIRWLNRSYSVIKILDLASGHTRQLTHRSRLFAPNISRDGTQIVAIKMSENNQSSMVLISSETGEEIRTLISSEFELYLNPTWSDDGQKIVFMVLGQQGKSICMINTVNKQSQVILPPTFTEISNPILVRNWVFFNGAFSGIENIYAMDTLMPAVYQVTSSAFGSFNGSPSPDFSRMVYSNYTANGYELAETELNPESWKPLNNITNTFSGPFQAIVDQEKGIVDSLTAGNKLFESRKYNKLTHLINLHSWAPAYIDYNGTEYKPGVSFMSQNLLSTAIATLGYAYDMNEQTGRFHADVSYLGWYPVMDLKVSTGLRASVDSASRRYTWNENTVEFNTYVPLRFNHGKYFSGLQPQVGINSIQITHNASTDKNLIEGSVRSLSYRIYAYNYIKSNNKDMGPRWGQTLDLNFRHTPFGDNNLGTIRSLETMLYFPGFARHHSLRIYGGWQQRVNGDYTYATLVNYPRGYFNRADEKLQSFQFNYKLPLLYPDLSIGPVVYIKRLKANFFFDYAQGKNGPHSLDMRSLGTELTADMHVMRLLLPIDMGARFAYRPDNKSVAVEFLFSVNLNSL